MCHYLPRIAFRALWVIHFFKETKFAVKIKSWLKHIFSTIICVCQKMTHYWLKCSKTVTSCNTILRLNLSLSPHIKTNTGQDGANNSAYLLDLCSCKTVLWCCFITSTVLTVIQIYFAIIKVEVFFFCCRRNESSITLRQLFYVCTAPGQNKRVQCSRDDTVF